VWRVVPIKQASLKVLTNLLQELASHCEPPPGPLQKESLDNVQEGTSLLEETLDDVHEATRLILGYLGLKVSPLSLSAATMSHKFRQISNLVSRNVISTLPRSSVLHHFPHLPGKRLWNLFGSATKNRNHWWFHIHGTPTPTLSRRFHQPSSLGLQHCGRYWISPLEKHEARRHYVISLCCRTLPISGGR